MTDTDSEEYKSYKSTYMKAYRGSNKEYYERTKKQNRARQRALVLLAKAFPDEYKRMLKIELEREDYNGRS